MVGNRQGWHAELSRSGYQRVDARGAIQQTVMRVNVQMNE